MPFSSVVRPLAVLITSTERPSLRFATQRTSDRFSSAATVRDIVGGVTDWTADSSEIETGSRPATVLSVLSRSQLRSRPGWALFSVRDRR